MDFCILHARAHRNRIPDETTILNFRYLLEVNALADDILRAVNALLARKGGCCWSAAASWTSPSSPRPAWLRRE
jgi:hypothetical protein